jgi:hypothetical protein
VAGHAHPAARAVPGGRVCAVPLTDMVRFPRFLIARLWTPEYGDPEVAEEFAGCGATRPTTTSSRAPATRPRWCSRARGDSRVDPAHAPQVSGAALGVATACGEDRPVHGPHRAPGPGYGQGKPASKQAEEAADVQGFLRSPDRLGPERVSVLDRIRSACATVAAQAAHVSVQADAIDALCGHARSRSSPPLLPAERVGGDDEAVAASVLAWNAVNFGSGWFPDLRKGPRPVRRPQPGRRLVRPRGGGAGRRRPSGWPRRTRPAARACSTNRIRARSDELLELFARCLAATWGRCWYERGRGARPPGCVRSAGGSAAALVDVPRHDAAGPRRGPARRGGGSRCTSGPRSASPTWPGPPGGTGVGALRRGRAAHRLRRQPRAPRAAHGRRAGLRRRPDRTRSSHGHAAGAGQPGGGGSIRACGVHAVELLSGRTGLSHAGDRPPVVAAGARTPAIKAVPPPSLPLAPVLTAG